MIQRRSSWPQGKDDTQTHEVFHEKKFFLSTDYMANFQQNPASCFYVFDVEL